MNNLVLVESPTKSKTLQRFLGEKYRVEATMGHVRDLPKSELGVDVEHNFEPQYIIPRDKRKRVNELKKIAEGAKTLYLATDPDREGEAIAWHLAELLKLDDRSSKIDKEVRKSKLENQTSNIKHQNPASNFQHPISIHRVVFHEITEEAIKEAFENPRGIDLKLVDAQQARRVLDRLVGYKLSPLLWEKIKKGLSAGRVQSVALRLIVEREREVLAFKAVEYWIIEAQLSVLGGQLSDKSSSVVSQSVTDNLKTDKLDSENRKQKTDNWFVATLIEKDGKKLPINNKEEADGHVKNLQGANYAVTKITQKEVRRYPYPPFTTSTLQQTASNRLGMSAKKTMMIAQNLYEHGFITYMRTDSVNLSTQAMDQVRSYIGNFIGKPYLPNTPRIFKSKSKNAQEAHEAIRPTNVGTKGDALRGWQGMNRDHIRLYDLIWKRFVACQMNEAVMDQTTIDVIARSVATKQSSTLNNEIATGSSNPRNDSDYLLRATGSVIKFEGWLKLYGKEAEEDGEEKKQVLPPLSEKQPLTLIQLLPGQHFTEPPPRYTEASLIKKLEELGIGRPSTYAPILSTIQERFYVERLDRKFIPTNLGVTVTDFLLKYFSDIIDYSFTAQMEDELDEIARGERKWQPTMEQFYKPFEKKLENVEKSAEKVKMELEKVDKKCPECGKDLVIRIGKFGKFLACSGFPDCKHTESLEEKIDAKCPEDGGDIVVRKTRKGKTFYGCKNWPVCKFASWTKPKKVDSGQVTGDSKASGQWTGYRGQ